jgi:LuxR family transcriptional regulator, maltose regulon positive regulatory protein
VLDSRAEGKYAAPVDAPAATATRETTETAVASTGGHIIRRPRLTGLLDEATARVIMLVAPAGYGKTTLAREWLALGARRGAWCRCTVASTDVAALAVSISRACASITGPGDRMRTRLRITSAPEEEVDVLAELMIEDIGAWPEDAWLVLDDYHLASSPASDQLVELLSIHSTLRLLVTARERPAWATPRRILYGELVEVGQSQLAMTREEGLEVLQGRDRRETQGLLALTDGWPAAIGLAALTPALEIPEAGLPTPLYDYIAEELYQSAPPALQQRLCEAAVAPAATVGLFEHLFAGDAESVLEAGARIGFFSRRGAADVDVHPLLRSFLERKLEEQSDAVSSEIAGRVGRFLVAERRWDDAFAVACRYRQAEVLVSLLERALEEMLAHGRLPTLARWLELARSIRADSPTVDLAGAEIAFRGGRYAEAETLALQAASRMPPAHDLAARAFYVAGQCAYFMERREVALDRYASSRAAARRQVDLREAVFGSFRTAVELQSPVGLDLFEEVMRQRRDSADDTLRVEAARLFVANHYGGLGEALEAAEPAQHFLDRATDPIVRSGYLHIFSNSLVLVSRYADALKIVERELRDVEEYRLEFVRAHAYPVQAAAHLGLRNFRAAFRSLHEAERAAVEQRDDHAQMNCAAVRLRLRTAEGAADVGLRETDLVWERPLSAGMYGEFLSCRALALTSVDAESEALELVSAAEVMTTMTETRVTCACIRAILALRGGPAADTRVRDAVSVVTETGNFDSFVAAYRVDPRLLAAAARVPGFRPRALATVHRSRDYAVAEAVGLRTSRRSFPTARAELSTREAEVYGLLAQGLTNAEIGRTLFISEVTVKAHLRRVYQKLGVRSRTEAALLAATQPETTSR